MDRNDVLKRVTAIFNDVLDRTDIELSDDTTAGDVEEWDSLTHIQLVVAVEKSFKVRFSAREIQTWKNVGQLVDSLLQKASV
jgi:acyl carrier protein